MFSKSRYTFKILADAVEEADLNTAKKCLISGVNPNDFIALDQPTLLFRAVQTGNDKLVKLLLKYKADPYRCFDKYSPFLKAKELGYLKIENMLPEAFPQDWFIIRLESVTGTLDNNGICFAISYLSLIMEPRLFEAIFTESAKIGIDDFQSAYQYGEKLFKKIYDKNKSEINRLPKTVIEDMYDLLHVPKELASISLNDKRKILLTIDLEETIRNLTIKDQVLVTLPCFFSAIKLISSPREYECTLFGLSSFSSISNYFSFKQERFVHNTLKLIMPLNLEFEGGLKCVDNFSGTFTKEELTNQFINLKKIFENTNLKYPISILIKANDHTIKVAFHMMTLNLVNINFFPVSQKLDQESFMDKLFRSLYTNNNITSFSALVYAHACDADLAKLKIKQWRNSESFRLLQEITKERLSLRDSMGSTWFNNVEHGGDVDTTKSVLKRKTELQLIIGMIGLGLSFCLTLLIASSRNDKSFLSNFIIFSATLIVIKQLINKQLISKTQAIYAEIEKFNQTNPDANTIVKIERNNNTYFLNGAQLVTKEISKNPKVSSRNKQMH